VTVDVPEALARMVTLVDPAEMVKSLIVTVIVAE
jgi:hypothetical protein